ncbi:MAG TPA: MJ0042-type zinc finger domain-containing protein [Xanthobacteraceae bacterium]|nr:MJ0042-type zinc finger domain-containing protein [Xanthobacteraceae bacterium]
MLIVCPSCTTAYRIELSTLGAAGRTVRCARCRATWFASVAELAPAALALPAVRDVTPPPLPVPDQSSEVDEPRHESGDIEASSGEAAAITIANSPPLVPAPAQDAAPTTGADIETVAARRVRAAGTKRRRAGRWPGLPTIILVLAGIIAALLNWRATVVRFVPQTSSLFSAIGLPVNLRGLSFDNVKTSVEGHDEVTVLVVDGTIANLTRQPIEVPRLRFAVRNAAGYEIYAWTALPAEPILAPGDRAPFRSRLASPPADAQDIIVRFFSRRDVTAAAN